jgi:hypothetical protein
MAKMSAQDKSKNIALQNLIFGTEERKLMVSPEFLNQAIAGYVSRRLNAVNKNLANLSATKSPKAYFAYCDIIDKCLDELKRIEAYYKFKKPVPSEFHELLLSKREHSISTMINRAWKALLTKATITDGVPDNTEPFEALLNDIMLYEDRLSPVNQTAVEMYFHSIRGFEAQELYEEAIEGGDFAGGAEFTEGLEFPEGFAEGMGMEVPDANEFGAFGV